MFQSTHLHEVWPFYPGVAWLPIRVSIHTPTWGVTNYGRPGKENRCVSIHTPTWGVTVVASFDGHDYKFQSTHLHEVWQVFGEVRVAGTNVSIHTPTWGVTHIRFLQKRRKRGFNPHTYMRCDQKKGYLIKVDKCFNPHTYMRCDRDYGCFCSKSYVSIHTPTWGVTLGRQQEMIFINVSIHTPTWGVTARGRYDDSLPKVSIHTPTWGVTSFICFSSFSSSVSIHTPTWGVTTESEYNQ